MTEIVEKFLEKKMVTNSNTKKNYIINIDLYFKRLKGDAPPEAEWRRLTKEQRAEYLKGLNQFIISYFNNGRTDEQYEEDLRREYFAQEEAGRPLLSRRTFFTNIKCFMISQNRDLAFLEFWDTLKARMKGAEPQLTDYILTKDTIKQILSHGKIMDRALFLMMASSGRRIDELLAIYPEDINLNTSPATMEVKRGYDYKKPGKVKPTTKSKTRTTCFLSDEAVEAYKLWMSQRDSYLKTAVKKTITKKKNAKRHTTKDSNDRRVFPTSYQNAMAIWQRLVLKSGLEFKDEVTKRRTLHIHCIRKFFMSYLGDYQFADFLSGHSTSLTRAYDKMRLEDRAEKYKKLMPSVTIFNSAPVKEYNEQMKLKDDHIAELQKKLSEMETTMANKIYNQVLAKFVEQHDGDVGDKPISELAAIIEEAV